jgi:hypothetical protein
MPIASAILFALPRLSARPRAPARLLITGATRARLARAYGAGRLPEQHQQLGRDFPCEFAARREVKGAVPRCRPARLSI